MATPEPEPWQRIGRYLYSDQMINEFVELTGLPFDRVRRWTTTQVAPHPDNEIPKWVWLLLAARQKLRQIAWELRDWAPDIADDGNQVSEGLAFGIRNRLAEYEKDTGDRVLDTTSAG